MGSAADDPNSWLNEKPQHLVTLNSFAMSETLITQAQWEVVATELPKVNLDLDPNPSEFKGTDLPVERINWEQAMEFCDRISQHTGHKITLPTESQWEYACRAGTTTQYNFGNTIDNTLANYDYNINRTTPVHNYPPNPWGLYNMHGNVWEWCLDDWHGSYNGAPTDGSAWYSCDKIARGGSWYNNHNSCRSACRGSLDITAKNDYLGFRIVINT